MNNEIPKTKAECFAVLDSMLSEEEKKELIGDEWSGHFGIGMWIRNNWTPTIFLQKSYTIM